MNQYKSDFIRTVLRHTTIEIFFSDMLGIPLESIGAEQTYVSDFFRFGLNRVDDPVNLRATRRKIKP
jgi:hypothetical protein